MELLIISLLLTKHVVADFFLQRSFMFKDKHIYGGKGGLVHATSHALLTWLCLIFFNPSLALILAAMDGVIHYHVDYIKSGWNIRTKASPAETRYWYAFGLDQLAHLLTYVLIVKIATWPNYL